MLPPILRAGHVVRRALVTATVTAMTAAALLPMASAQAAAQKTIYVSPNGTGNCSSASNPCSLTQAQSAVRADNKNMSGDIDVILADGVYHRSSTLTFTGADSGTNGHFVNWRAAPGAHPVFSGGSQVTGWSKMTNSSVWKAALPTGVTTRQLWVNGVRATLASQAPPSGMTPTSTGFTINSTALQNLSDPGDLEMVFQSNGWSQGICPASSIAGNTNPVSTTVTMKQPCWATGQAFRYNLPFRLQNAMEFLTTPGTFAFNNKTSTLYYLPRPGEDLKTADVEVGNLTNIVALNGTTSSPVANITFNGIGFEYSTWTQPDQDVGFVPEQATIFVTSASEVQKWDATGGTAGRTTPAAFAEHTARSVGVYNSTFTHLGAAGLAMDGGTQSSTVRGNSFTDISGNDIQVGTVTHPQQSDNALIDFNDVIKDNYISHAGVEFWGGIGIWAGYVQRIQIQHNEIDNSGYSAISIGWGWGYAPTVPNISADNVISDNYINTNKLWRSDGGGIYTLGPQKSNHPGKISGNYIINNWGAGAPLYFDQGSTYWNVSGNVEQNEVHGNYLGLNPNSNDPTGTINFTNNYTDGQPGKCGCKSAVISGTTFYNGALPGAAQAIADGAGLEPAYRYLATDDGAIETPLATAFAYPYPYPWTYRFSFANHNGKYSINGAGADIWQGNDEYGSIYQPGSFGPGSTAVVRVDGESDTDGWAKAGLVVRNRLAAGGTSVARSVYPNDQFGYAALVLTPSNRVSLQWDGNSSGQLNQSVSVGASTLHTPIWLRLVDGDGTLTGSYSTDGTKWTTVGTAKLTGAASVEDAGMIWSAHTNGVVGTATFSNFLVGDPITGVASSRCVDIPNSDPANGNQLQIFDCNKTKAQAWTFPGDGTIRAEGKCMDVQSAKIADGTPVETYDCNGTKAQQWTYNSTTKQFQALGKCLAATGGGTTNYTKLVIDTCQAGASNQQWSHP